MPVNDDVMPVTTNGAESYHGHLNAEFNAPHPNIYIFVEVLQICKSLFTNNMVDDKKQQAATYVTVSSLSKSRTVPRPTREKSACLRNLFTRATLCYSAVFATATPPDVRLSVRLSHAGIVPSRAKAGS